MTAGPEKIASAVARLRAGGVVAFPTETVYGLGADALDPAAIARVFALKGRPPNNPLIVHVADEAMASSVVSDWPDAARQLARAFWPGPLTIVLPKAPNIPDAVTAGGPTVAVRCPAHHMTLSLLQTFGRPLVGPSANPSGRISPTTAAHVRESFTEDQVLILDGGPCRGGIESTVVSLVENPPRVLRPGLIGAGQIAKVLRCEVREPDPSRTSEPTAAPLPAPGQLPVHYAPRARAVLLNAAAIAQLPPSPFAVILAISASSAPAAHRLIPMPADAAAYAARLYAALREADALNPALIVIERPPSTGPIWDAIADRLRRATVPPSVP
jgi:L-threonylcarbamoyladenylate synthase